MDTTDEQQSTHIPITTVLEALADQTVADEGDYSSVTLQILQTGEVAYRLHIRGSEDYEGGIVQL